MHDKLVAEPIRLTYADYCELPDDGRRYEILDGDLYMSPSPIPLHQRIAFRLAMILQEFAFRHRLGEVFVAPIDVLLGEYDVVVPDIAYVSNARSAIIKTKYIEGAPDLLIEVLSPGTSKRDLRDKRNIYSRSGVDWYWIVDPAKGTLLELRRSRKSYAISSQARRGQSFKPGLFPGLAIKLDELWE